MMKFQPFSNIDVSKWSNVEMKRENNASSSDKLNSAQNMPKFGAGSEFRREQREEARRKKFGIARKEYNPAAQPWILKADGEAGKQFRGVKEGGIGDSCDYFVFVQAADNSFNAYPVDDWYNFKPVPNYKALDAEQAEAAFEKRNSVLNYFQVMGKKMKKDEHEDEEEDKGEFRIGDEDETENAGEDKSGSDGDDEDGGLEFISSSESDDEGVGEDAGFSVKGVEDEDAIRKMENSDSDEEEKSEEKNIVALSTEAEPTAVKGSESSVSSSSTSDSDDFENESTFNSALFVSETKRDFSSGNNSPNKKVIKRKRVSSGQKSADAMSPSKKMKGRNNVSSLGSLPSLQPEVDSVEDMVRRYLMRKPMTTTELLKKLRITNLPREQLVKTVAQVLKQIKPEQQTIQGKMFLSLKQN
uniref:Transcription initiation factor IIF subunit alpha n=1 Tax=Strigamia maritima TaxID=126957 RepID=T1IMU2_STRMM